MKRFVPYEKMSKKQKRAADAARRGSWHGLNPVTRVAGNDRKRYSRKEKHRQDPQDM